MKKIKEELDQLYGILERSKQELSFKKGQIEMKMKELKEVGNVASIEKAKREIGSLENEKQKLATKIQKEYNLLKEKYPW